MSSRKKILIVDDSEMNRSLLSDMLSNQFDILEAEDGLEASAILYKQEYEIALVLLDIVMPKMDGFELLTLMNKKEWIKNIPVIMISAESVPDYMDRAYDLGVMEFITRPFDERTVQHRVNSTIMLTAKQRELSHMVAEQMYEKEKTNRMMIEVLANLVEFRNGESGMHVMHIQTITELLLNELLSKTDQYKIEEKDKQLICTAAALHDIGKIAIPSEILNKPGKLTPEEFEIMKTHAEEGARILSNIPGWENEPLIQMAYKICMWHHERYDGRGYPDGLKGDEIPIVAQIVSVADVYDALTSIRVYKPAFTHETAVKMILNGECGRFNPILLECLSDISDALQKNLDSVTLEHTSEKEILNTLDRMVKGNELNATERTLRLLERERLKYQFMSELSQDVWFEYTVSPELVVLSGRGMDGLEIPETIVNPRESILNGEIFTRKDFQDLMMRMEQTTPKKPILEQQYVLNINGRMRWHKVLVRVMWSEGENPQYEGAIGKIIDIHDNVENIRHLEELTTKDPMTGLLNHNAARELIEATLHSTKNSQYALILFDLDNFDGANAKYGHLFGDEVLRFVAEKINGCTRHEDICARLGGDEYIIFMEYRKTIRPQVERIFQHLYGNYKGFDIQVSMGISFADQCGGSYEKLFWMADTAMFTVKNNGKNGYRFYE
jgi:putative two-component system response regulator